MFKSNSFILYVVILIVGISMSSCVTTRNVVDGDLALKGSKIKVISDIPGKRKAEIVSGLNTLIKQEPHRVKLFNPRTWGGKYTPYDSSLTEDTRSDFETFLRNRKGFYRAEVNYTEQEDENAVEVTYFVDTGPQYSIRVLNTTSEDASLLSLINEHSEKRIIKEGDPLDASTFDNEKDRIVNLLQNKGYANFTKNFIEFRGDSLSNGAVDITIHIYPPGPNEIHKRYSIGQVRVFTDHLNGEYTAKGKIDTIEGVEYIARGDEFRIKPEGISTAINLRKGDLYEKKMETKTYTKLTGLSPYRFAIINPSISEEADSTINFDVFLTPRKNKWGFDAGTNFFYSTFSAGARNNLLGFNSTLNWENRNFLSRAYRYLIDLEGTFEFDFSQFPTIDPNTISFQLENTVEIPKNIEIFNLARFLNRIGIVKDKAFRNFKRETTTELNLGYRFSDIFDLYRLNSINASWSYNYQPTSGTRIRYTQMGLNYLNVSTDSIFQERFLGPNPLLANSFTSQLFTGLLFRDFSVYHLTRENVKQSQWAFLGNLEVSGLENYALNSIINAFRSNDGFWKVSEVGFSKFVRVDTDIRWYKKFGGKKVLAMRFNPGIAVPYGGDEVVPFVKQFFVGGPNSLRAWRLRELGPGGYSEYIQGPQDLPPFLSGEFKLDFSAEYRFKLFWLMDGALFMDVGNVWNLREDSSFSNGKISSDFLDQLAVGTGWGLRFDLTYFILRFDMGYKLRNPFPDELGSHSAWGDNSMPFGNINFAINYPF